MKITDAVEFPTFHVVTDGEGNLEYIRHADDDWFEIKAEGLESIFDPESLEFLFQKYIKSNQKYIKSNQKPDDDSKFLIVPEDSLREVIDIVLAGMFVTSKVISIKTKDYLTKWCNKELKHLAEETKTIVRS